MTGEPLADQSKAARSSCAYCLRRSDDLHWTGRRWLCRYCFEDAIGPVESDEEQQRGA